MQRGRLTLSLKRLGEPACDQGACNHGEGDPGQKGSKASPGVAFTHAQADPMQEPSRREADPSRMKGPRGRFGKKREERKPD
jgi:hypothetical protein